MNASPNPMDGLALAIGRANITWGALQDSLGHLFSAVLYGGMDETALAAWHSHKNDRAQREMLVAAAKVRLEAHPDALRAVDKLAKKINAKSYLRNDMIHSAYALLELTDGTKIPIPHGYYGNQCAKKLGRPREKGEDLLRRFNNFRKCLEQLIESSDKAFQSVVNL